jgi:hypothetical protein
MWENRVAKMLIKSALKAALCVMVSAPVIGQSITAQVEIDPIMNAVPKRAGYSKATAKKSTALKRKKKATASRKKSNQRKTYYTVAYSPAKADPEYDTYKVSPPPRAETTYSAPAYTPSKTFNVIPSADGKMLHLVGEIANGSTGILKKAIADNPNIKLLVLSSVGGRLIEGAAMAHVIRSAGLDTYVEFSCSSACIFAFLAGKNRIIAPHAKLGFHQASNAVYYGSKTIAEDGNVMMKGIFEAAKLDTAIIDKALKTSPADVWYPETDLLLSGNVASRMAQKDDLNLAVGPWLSGKKLVDMLNDDPVWKDVFSYRPEIYQNTAGSAWDSVALGAAAETAIKKARSQMIQYLLSDLDQYPDSLLEDYVQLEQEIRGANNSYYTQTCYAGFGFPFYDAITLTSSQKERQDALLKSMAKVRIKSAVPDKAEQNIISAKVMELYALMVANHGLTAETVQYSLCSEAKKYLAELIKLPRAERLSMIRSLAASRKFYKYY